MPRSSNTTVAFATLIALLATTPALAQRAACHNGASFERWLDDFKREAVTQGVSQRTIASTAHLMVYDQQVVNKDRGQKVFSQTFLEFSDRMVAKHRIDGGIQRIAKNHPMFQKIEQQFGVPGPVIAARCGCWCCTTTPTASSPTPRAPRTPLTGPGRTAGRSSASRTTGEPSSPASEAASPATARWTGLTHRG